MLSEYILNIVLVIVSYFFLYILLYLYLFGLQMVSARNPENLDRGIEKGIIF